MPVYDANLMLRTTGTLTADESVGPVTVWGGIHKGLAVRVVVPSAFGANDTILPKVYTSADNSTYNLVAQYAEGAIKPYGTGAVMIVPFPVMPGKQYVKLELDVTVASTTATFGVVTAGIVENPGFDWERGSHFA